MPAVELDALAVGTICLDRDAFVLCCNAAGRRFLGRRPAAVIGRNVFDEVAPWIGDSALHGHFQRLVHQIDRDENFICTFQRPGRRCECRIRMTSDIDTGLIWLLVDQLDRISPSDDSRQECTQRVPERRAS